MMANETAATDSLPSGTLLIITSLVDSALRAVNLPEWQEYLPFGIGDTNSSFGWLSYDVASIREVYLPKLPTYTDFVAQNDLEHWSVASMAKFAKTPSTSIGDVTSRDALCLLFFLVLFMRQLKALLIPHFCDFGRKAGRSAHGPEWENHNQERIIKFGEYVFRLVYHSAVSVYGLWYFWDKPWWDHEAGGVLTTIAGHPYHAIETGMQWYYMIQCAYNVEAMLSLLELSFTAELQNPLVGIPVKIGWSSNCRGDFNEMFAHHVITNFLIFGSSYYRFTRIGSMVFMVHDISDVPVDMSKLANFMKWKITTIVCFVILVIVWAITRLGILPFVIIKGVYEFSDVLYLEENMDVLQYCMIINVGFKNLLCGITMLHAFWFFILVRIGYRLVTKGERHDLSEHKQGEDYVEKKSQQSTQKKVV